MPDFEAVGAVGEAMTGGLAARAVEDAAGERGGHTHERNCLNCGCELAGEFCHCCGQHAHVHRTIGAWWHDFLHSVLHLDGKFWRTLPMLAWRPGELTRRYAHGERAKFISPLALFLFTVFLMFAVFSAAGPDFSDGLGLSQSIEEGISEERESLQELQTERSAASGTEAAKIDENIRETRENIARLERLRDQGVTRAVMAAEDDVQGGSYVENAYKKAKENPELLLYKLQANAYKFSWALIPISVPFVWIMFLHRRRYRREFTAYDHLVFVTYSIAFMSLAMIVYVVLKATGFATGFVELAALIVPPLHMYRQLKGAYGLSRFSAIWRTLILLIFASIALSLFASLLLVLGALG